MANKRKQKLKTAEAWTEEELANYLGFKFMRNGFFSGRSNQLKREA